MFLAIHIIIGFISLGYSGFTIALPKAKYSSIKLLLGFMLFQTISGIILMMQSGFTIRSCAMLAVYSAILIGASLRIYSHPVPTTE